MENKIRFSEVLKKYTMVIVLALVIILFTVNTGGKMLKSNMSVTVPKTSLSIRFPTPPAMISDQEQYRVQ